MRPYPTAKKFNNILAPKKINFHDAVRDGSSVHCNGKLSLLCNVTPFHSNYNLFAALMANVARSSDAIELMT